MKTVTYQILDLRAAEGTLFNTSALEHSVRASILRLTDPAVAFTLMVPEDPSAEVTEEERDLLNQSRDRFSCYLAFIDTLANMDQSRAKIQFDPTGLDAAQREFINTLVKRTHTELAQNGHPGYPTVSSWDAGTLTLLVRHRDDDLTDPEAPVEEAAPAGSDPLAETGDMIAE